jgi:phospholipid/cholesterol/gamma-HCH transport system substrate-binding protein
MSDNRRLEVKVGLFVVGALALAIVGVLLLGRSKQVFAPRAKLRATFSDVGGLVQGAPVRIAGVNVGTVSQITFVRVRPRPLIRVDLDVSQSAIDLVRADSVARISSQGLLGDKIVEVSAGSTAEPEVESGGEVRTAEAPDLDKMLRQASVVIDDARRVADRVASAVEQFAEAKTVADVRGIAAHLHSLLRATDKGVGLMHALFYDKRTAEDVSRVARELALLSSDIDRGVRHLDAVLAATDHEGKQVINNVSRAARSVGDTAETIERSQVVANLAKASGDLALLTSYMRSGRGTLGALVIDPTVYEQLVQVLGGVGRSRILRALVRYAISRDEEKVVGRVVDEKNVPEVKPPKTQPATTTPRPPAPEPQRAGRPRSSAKR